MTHIVHELAAGVGAMVGAFVAVVVGTAAVSLTTDPGFGTLLIENYGPIGIAVVVLYRRIDKLEDRVRDNEQELNGDDSQ